MRTEDLLIDFFNHLVDIQVAKEGYTGTKLAESFLKNYNTVVLPNNKEQRIALVKIPEDIITKENEVLSKCQAHDEMVLLQKTKKMQVEFVVEKEKDDPNITNLSNPKRREAEVKKRLREDKDYLALCDNILKMRKDLDTERLSLEYLKRKFRSFESLALLEKR